jgi:hypothetical protein
LSYIYKTLGHALFCAYLGYTPDGDVIAYIIVSRDRLSLTQALASPVPILQKSRENLDWIELSSLFASIGSKREDWGGDRTPHPTKKAASSPKLLRRY